MYSSWEFLPELSSHLRVDVIPPEPENEEKCCSQPHADKSKPLHAHCHYSYTEMPTMSQYAGDQYHHIQLYAI